MRGTLGWTKQVSIETRLFSWIRDLPHALRICDQSSGSLLPYNFKSRQLNVMFFTAIMLLYRPASPGVPPSGAAILASSFSAGIFEDFLARGELGFLAPVFNFHLMTAAYAQLACYKYPSLWPIADGELEIINKCLLEMAKRYPTAVGAQRVIKAVFRAVSAQNRHEGPIHIALEPEPEPEPMKYFKFFGPDLCSKWASVMPAQSDTIQSVNEIGQPLPCRNPSHNGPMPSSDEALETASSFDPNSGTTLITGQTNTAGTSSFTDALLADIGTHDSYFASNGAFTAIGNWMLGDWTADIDWMTGGFGA